MGQRVKPPGRDGGGGGERIDDTAQKLLAELLAAGWTALEAQQLEAEPERPLPDRPTHHLPGTPGKIAVMRRRAAKRQQLFHPDDARLDDSDDSGDSEASSDSE